MASTLDELLNPQSVQQVFNLLLAVYKSNSFPVESWQTGGVERTRLMAIATVLSDISVNYLPFITGGGFIDYSTGDWLTLLAAQLYDIERNEATFTQGTINLSTVSSASGPYSFSAGDLIVSFTDTGNRYFNVSSGSLAASNTSDVTFVAEFAGASFADDSNADVTLVTSLPGVVVTNPGDTFTDVSHVGSGTGTLVPSGTVPSTSNYQILVTFTGNGVPGVATWEYSINGSPSVVAGAVSAAALTGTPITVTLTSGDTGTAVFAIDDTYLFGSPGTWITTQGADAETDTALATRCRDRWSTLASFPVTNFYEELTLSTPSVGSQITAVFIDEDSIINNKVNIVIIGAAGALPLDTVAAVQAYLDPRVPITDLPYVTTPTVQSVPITGTITCSASLLTAVQSGVNTAITNYLIAVGVNGTIRVSEVIEKVMGVTGVVDIATVTINGSAANYTLGTSTTYVVADHDSDNFTFTYITQ